MSEQVKVEDLQVFAQFRAAMVKFAQAADQSLMNADSQIASMRSWLEGEQTTYWTAQLRKRSEMVTQAREAVRQKKLYKDASGRMPGAVEEEKHLKRCQHALEEAEEKLKAIKRALPRLEKEADLYRGGVARLNRALQGDVPRALALLDRLAASLEEYLQLGAAAGGDAMESASAAAFAGMARGEKEASSEAAETSGTATAQGNIGGTPMPLPQQKKEGGDVADGQ